MWSVAAIVSVAALAGLGGFAATAAVLDISGITQFLNYDKSYSISQLIKCK